MKTQRKILYVLAFCLAFACTREKENPETPLELKTREVYKQLEHHHTGMSNSLQKRLAHATDSMERVDLMAKIELHNVSGSLLKEHARHGAKFLLEREKAKRKTSEEAGEEQ